MSPLKVRHNNSMAAMQKSWYSTNSGPKQIRLIAYLFLVLVQVVSIHSNGDPKRSKRILKDRVCSCSQSLADSMMQIEMKAIGKETEAAREAYEGLPL